MDRKASSPASKRQSMGLNPSLKTGLKDYIEPDCPWGLAVEMGQIVGPVKTLPCPSTLQHRQ